MENRNICTGNKIIQRRILCLPPRNLELGEPIALIFSYEHILESSCNNPSIHGLQIYKKIMLNSFRKSILKVSIRGRYIVNKILLEGKKYSV